MHTRSAAITHLKLSHLSRIILSQMRVNRLLLKAILIDLINKKSKYRLFNR